MGIRFYAVLKGTLGAALLAAGGSAVAASPLSFNYAEADYLQGEFTGDSGDAADTDGGFRIALNQELGSRSHFLLEYDQRNLLDSGADDLNRSFLSTGLGFKSNTRRVPNFALFGALTYERTDLKFDPRGPDDNRETDEGYGLQLGMRGWVADTLELNLSYKRMDFGDGSPFLANPDEDFEVDLARAGLVFPVSRNTSLVATYQQYDGDVFELEEYVLGVRYTLSKGSDRGQRRR